MAVRNQFFTPRYVVQFLADNTIGRLWLEMNGEETRLKTICEYLVRSADESLQVRPRKDPRDLHIFDPACGSGHFLLYSFDLLLAIYERSMGC
jgi:type I restriction-modification system DNA methylase subunit